MDWKKTLLVILYLQNYGPLKLKFYQIIEVERHSKVLRLYFGEPIIKLDELIKHYL